jgi:hypothetical protein
VWAAELARLRAFILPPAANADNGAGAGAGAAAARVERAVTSLFLVSGYWSVVIGQWLLVSGYWSVVSGSLRRRARVAVGGARVFGRVLVQLVRSGSLP